MPIKLFHHQEDGKKFIINNNGVGALYFDPGLGKTSVTLSIYKELKEKNPKLKLVVICPLTLIQNAWIDDILKFYPELTYQDLHAKKPIQDVDVYLMNYAFILSKKNLAVIIELLKKNISMGVLDESQICKSATALTTKTILSIRTLFLHRLCLSGTPCPNGEVELWAQMLFLNDDIFNKSFYAFRNQYFHLQRGKQTMPNGTFMSKAMAREIFSKGWKYAITPKNRTLLLEKIRPWAMFRAIKDCIDLPEQTEIIRKVPLSEEQARSYKELKDHLVTELSGTIVAAHYALTKMQKLREICGGFIIDAEGKNIPFKQNAKLNELAEVIDELGDKQAIIWAFFTWECDAIKGLLGDKALIINGTVTEDQKNEAIQKFKSGEIQYLICNPRSVAHGLTLVNCHYSIYYSLDFSQEMLEQSMARIYRIGQKNQCFYIFLQASGTIDETIYQVLKKKGREEDVVKGALK